MARVLQCWRSRILRKLLTYCVSFWRFTICHPGRNRGHQNAWLERPNAYRNSKKHKRANCYGCSHPRTALGHHIFKTRHASKPQTCMTSCEKCDLPLRTWRLIPQHGTTSKFSTALACSNVLAFIANGSMRVLALRRYAMNTSQNMNAHTTALTSAVPTQY